MAARKHSRAIKRRKTSDLARHRRSSVDTRSVDGTSVTVLPVWEGSECRAAGRIGYFSVAIMPPPRGSIFICEGGATNADSEREW